MKNQMKKQFAVLIAMAIGIVVHGQSIFTTQTLPTNNANDGRAIELGVKIRSSVNGQITGVKFYKISGQTGTHTGELYDRAGNRLAQATFTNETSLGWQSVTFATPVSITANTTYVAAVFSSTGAYTNTNNSFGAAVTNGNISAISATTDGANGVYIYTTTPAFPTSFYSGNTAGTGSNYWVDVNFTVPVVVPPPPPPPPTATMSDVIFHGLHAVALMADSTTASVYLLGGGKVDSRSVGQTSYKWFQKSGAATTILQPDSVGTKATGLVRGTYIYGFILKDNRANLSDTAYKTVTIN